MKRRMMILISMPLLLLAAMDVWGDVSLPSCLGSNMVLQRDVSVPIWGWASPGEEVQVQLNDQVKIVTTGSDGNWKIQLSPLKAGGPFRVTITGQNEIVLENILIGEVWVCSGQSNMVMSVERCLNADKEIAGSLDDGLRLFRVKDAVADTPQSNCEGMWEICAPTTVASFSAVAYFFGRELRKELQVPVGLIMTAWGGTPVESWISAEVLQSDQDFQPILDRYKEAVASYPSAKADFDLKVSAWQKKAEEARALGKKPPNQPKPPLGPGHPRTPSGLFNAMVHPLIPYGVAGALWYQGEANADRAEQYRELLPALIKDWRDRWAQDNFAFGIVQLANYMDVQEDPNRGSAWAELREAQAMTSRALPDVGLALAIDVGEAKDIHPKNKQEVGRRLALWALAKRYGMDVEYSGPVLKSMKVKGDRVRLRFTHAQGGCRSKSEPLLGFAVAGEDRVFKRAEAEISGRWVWVHSEEVADPVAVRYAWADNPQCNLINEQGLPAVPFRTDDWPGKTHGQR